MNSRYVIAVGVFDGAHRGHQAIVRQAFELAKIQQAKVCILCCDPMPYEILSGTTVPRIQSMQSRVDILKSYGADEVRILEMTKEMMADSPQVFYRKCLQEYAQVVGWVEGSDFRFGHKRAAGIEELSQWCNKDGILFAAVSTQYDMPTGQEIRSSIVREAIQQGDMAIAHALLGRPWCIQGSVTQGAKLARQWGVPTANLTEEAWQGLYVPALGVYVATITVEDAQMPAVVSMGNKPTLEGGRKLWLEAHALDNIGDVNWYGKTMQVAFLDRLRGQCKFGSVEDLKAQIASDVAQARQYFSLQTQGLDVSQ